MQLAIGHPSDPHIRAVQQALRLKSSDLLVWSAACRDGQRAISIEKPVHGKASCGLLEIGGYPVEHVNSVWLRRPGAMEVPPSLQAEGAAAYRSEWESSTGVVVNIIDGLAPKAWVNRPMNAALAEDKLGQLMHADLVGIRTPATLISNDPVKVRSFYDMHGGQVIHKMFNPYRVGNRIMATAMVTREAIARQDSIRLVPGIYQEYIKAVYEARVTVMGRSVFSAGAYRESSAIDAKVEFFTSDNLRRIDLPDDLGCKCVLLTRRLGLSFATMDIGKTPEGEWVLFDVNQSGNFLWVEDKDPGIPLLDAFSEFLLSASEDFSYREGAVVIRLRELH